MFLLVQTNHAAMDKSLEYLSSRFRVNNAADDASGYAVSSKLDAQTQRLKEAINTLMSQRTDLGATQNQLALIQANLATSLAQTTASVSSIHDADMAAEMATFTKNNILTQASVSMLTQAHQAAQNVIPLFDKIKS